MAGGEYEPEDTRNVTLTHNAPGMPNDWRDADAAESRKRDDRAGARRRSPTNEENDAVPGTQAANPAEPPPGVEDGEPFSAEDAASADRNQD